MLLFVCVVCCCGLLCVVLCVLFVVDVCRWLSLRYVGCCVLQLVVVVGWLLMCLVFDVVGVRCLILLYGVVVGCRTLFAVCCVMCVVVRCVIVVCRVSCVV